MKTREPAVAGTFYPSSTIELTEMLDKLLQIEKETIKN